MEQAAIDRHQSVKRAWLASRGEGRGPGGHTGKGVQQDGTTNRNPTGGLGGGSVGRSSATKSAFRNADAYTPNKKGDVIHTVHNGRSWEITVSGRDNKIKHRAKGRASSPEAALDKLVNEYHKHA